MDITRIGINIAEKGSPDRSQVYLKSPTQDKRDIFTSLKILSTERR